MNNAAVILFPTNAHVMRAEKLLKEAKIACKLIPVPRHLSSDCGVCICVDHQSIETVKSFLEKKQLDYDAIAPQI